MTKKRIYKSYPQSFKEEAVALVTEQNYSVAEAATALGINPNLIYKWKDKIECEASGITLNNDERAELKMLRAENKRLKMEQEILKKATAFFVKEMK